MLENIKAVLKNKILGRCTSQGCKRKATYTITINTDKLHIKRDLCEEHCKKACEIFTPSQIKIKE